MSSKHDIFEHVFRRRRTPKLQGTGVTKTRISREQPQVTSIVDPMLTCALHMQPAHQSFQMLLNKIISVTASSNDCCG